MNKLQDIITDMAIAHDMSHEPFCDSSSWKDDFKEAYEKALLLAAEQPVQVTDEMVKRAWYEYGSAAYRSPTIQKALGKAVLQAVPNVKEGE